MAQAQAQMNPVQQNAMARNLLMQTALPIKKKVASITGVTLGQTVRQRLLNVGLTTRLIVHVKAQIDITGAVTASPTMGGWGLVPQVIVTDYNQIERINTDAASLQIIQGMKSRAPVTGSITPFDYVTAATDFSSVPGVNASGGIANNQPLEFFIEVPFAVNPDIGDLRGMSLSQAVVGEQFLTMKIADALVNADPSLAPFVAGVATTDFISIDIYQEYYQPQNMASLPMIDLQTIYEVKGLFRSGSDIATTGQKLINYPNVRTVLSSYHSLIDNNTAMDTTKILSIQLLVNSSQILREDSFKSKRKEMLNALHAVAPVGAVYMDHRAQPISTALFGNVQMALNFATITGGNTYALSTFESLYASGTPLPGITTQG